MGGSCVMGGVVGKRFCAVHVPLPPAPPPLPPCLPAVALCVQEEHDALEAANVESVLENVPFVDSVSLIKRFSSCTWRFIGLSKV